MTPRVVMKFGGTSLGTAYAMGRACDHVIREERACLVVVSAVGGVTDLLLEAAGTAKAGGNPVPFLREIQKRQDEIVSKLGLPRELLTDLYSELERLISGISMLRELTPRVQDAFVSLGERMSSRLTAEMLIKKGKKARAYDSWDLGFITNDAHGCAELLPAAPAFIKTAIGALPQGEIAVVTGYIARTEEGEITTLGRGGSDLSAAIFGAAAGAEEILIWTDVPGILRADPRVVQQAAVIPQIRFEEAAELAYFGAKVLHPRSIEPARRAGIPVRVLGTFQVDPQSDMPVSRQGTLICDQAPGEPVRALAIRRQVQSLLVHSTRMLEAHGFLSRVFAVFERHRISIDVIATSEVSISMTFDRDEVSLDAAVKEISEFAQVERIPERSILCLVGAGLREDTSLLARVFQTLATAKIPVHVISQGASRINITLVTDPPHGRNAMQALYHDLFEPA
ncbi:aspartate kinase [Myxococcota bacterium]